MTRYPYPLAVYDLGELASQIDALAISAVVGLAGDADHIEVLALAELPPADKARVDAVVAAYAPSPTWPALSVRAAALAMLTDASPGSVQLRAVLLVILDELNRARAADGLAALTATTVRAAIAAKIRAGSADS